MKFADALEEQLVYERNGRNIGSGRWREFAGMVSGAPPYWLADDVARALIESLESFPDREVALSEPPSESGFCLLERDIPFAEIDPISKDSIGERSRLYFLHGFGWSRVGEAISLGFCITANRPIHSEDGAKLGPLIYVLDAGSFENHGLEGHALNRHDRLVTFARALWEFTKQPIAKVSEQDLDRATERRVQRVSPDRVTTIRVVHLRATHYDSDVHQPNGSKHHCRWVVRAHWRNQPCGPLRSERKPVMVVAHIKGPKDAPLKVKGIDLFAVTR